MSKFFVFLPIVLSLTLLIPTPKSHAALSYDSMWNKTQPLMEKGIELYTSSEDPEKRDWTRVVTFRGSKMQSIINDILEVLGSSVISDTVTGVDKLSAKIRKEREEIRDLRAKIIGAPEQSRNPLTATRESLKKDIAECSRKIEEYEADIEELKRRAKQHIRELNLPIPPETVDYLCIAPNGSSIAQIMAVSTNIKHLIEYVDGQFGAAGVDDAQIAHVYAGLYFIGCRTQVESYDIALKEIHDVYLPKLDKLYADAKDLIVQIKDKLRTAEGPTKTSLSGSLETNRRSIEVMDAYRKYLARQEGNLTRDRAAAAERLQTAVITLKTVSISSQVIGLVRTSMKELDSVLQFQLPEARVLDDVYKNEFANLMELLKSK